MNEKEARKVFNKEARYFERGLPPTREDMYAISFRGKLLSASTPDGLFDKFWQEVKGEG